MSRRLSLTADHGTSFPGGLCCRSGGEGSKAQAGSIEYPPRSSFSIAIVDCAPRPRNTCPLTLGSNRLDHWVGTGNHTSPQRGAAHAGYFLHAYTCISSLPAKPGPPLGAIWPRQSPRWRSVLVGISNCERRAHQGTVKQCLLFTIDGPRHGFTSCPLTELYHPPKVPGPIRIADDCDLINGKFYSRGRSAQSVSRCPAGLVSAVESGAWIGEQATASDGSYAELCSATTLAGRP